MVQPFPNCVNLDGWWRNIMSLYVKSWEIRKKSAWRTNLNKSTLRMMDPRKPSVSFQARLALLLKLWLTYRIRSWLRHATWTSLNESNIINLPPCRAQKAPWFMEIRALKWLDRQLEHKRKKTQSKSNWLSLRAHCYTYSCWVWGDHKLVFFPYMAHHFQKSWRQDNSPHGLYAVESLCGLFYYLCHLISTWKFLERLS